MSSSRNGAAQSSDASQVSPPPPNSATRLRLPCGRDDHFRIRLSRLSAEHVALALSIYRSAALVRAIFALAHLSNVPRIAISLGHPNRGPFVIVTRHGHFVTCLGEGMSAWPLPVVPRKQLLAIRARLDALRRFRLNRG